ncbi:MAG: V-type ATP synthase subunit A, partial [Candidatus Diapherotrites archaeon]|nr:V-type ATP synthase subunit A [Candidatus Diapherotrites archaeon]
EAMREISGRLEEMPGEEGYPAYLANRLAQFYERAGRTETFNGDLGSVTVIGAVSPAGGDFSEPVTQNTLKIVKVFWALDAKLAQRRHFPSINWITSYSLYLNNLNNWFSTNIASDWGEYVEKSMRILQEEEKLLEIVQLVGSDSLPDEQQLVLEIARMLREFFLQQNAFHEVDTYCPPQKSYALLKTIHYFNNLAEGALRRDMKVKDILLLKSKNKIANVKFEPDYEKILKEIESEMQVEFEGLR